MNSEERYCVDETLKHMNRVRSLLSDIIGKVFKRGIWHDKTKLENPEFDGFVEYTPKLRGMTYGSDEYKECLEKMNRFLDHHYQKNPHHPEHYENGISDMSLIDIVEMLSDWKAATERHADGDIMKSIENNQKRFGYSDDVKNILINTVEEMGWS